MLIKIEKIEPLKEDERGNAYEFPVRASKNIIVLNRHKGSISGRHYHKGTTESKSPETFFLAKGKVRIFVKDVKTGEEEEYTVEENHKIYVPAMTYHEVHALTDIMLIEFNVEEVDYAKETVKILDKEELKK